MKARWKNEAEKIEFGFHDVFRLVKASQILSLTQIFDPGTMGGDMGSECLVTDGMEMSYQMLDDVLR